MKKVTIRKIKKTSKLAPKINNAFTLVEMMVAVSALVIIATLSVISYKAWREQAAETEIKSDLTGLLAGMENAKNWTNNFPVFATGTAFDGTNSTKDIFVSSKGVMLTYVGGDEKGFCVNAISKSIPEQVFYLKSSGGSSDIKIGSCDSSED